MGRVERSLDPDGRQYRVADESVQTQIQTGVLPPGAVRLELSHLTSLSWCPRL